MEYYIYIIASLLILPGLIYGMYAQASVNKTFNAFKTIESTCGKSASEVARLMLDQKGLFDVKIVKIKGDLTDNYNPKTKTLSLSESTFNSKSVAAIGVAAHEVGHAYQHSEGYLPIKIRTAFVPIVNIGSALFWPLIIIGILLMLSAGLAHAGEIVVWIGVALYGSSTLFCLITVPVEYNASNRALAALRSLNILEANEIPMADKVLKAAAKTYVAALIVSALYFIRFFMYIFLLLGKNRD